MDQEKIGKFISRLRKEKNMTQKELAENLGVSINAVSKWERGLCLMDVSLMKPLAEILDTSITEIINGEKNANDDINLQTSDAIEKTIKYSNDKIRKVKKKSKIIIIVLVISCLIGLIFGYKVFLIYQFDSNKYTDQESIEHKKQFVAGLKNQDKMIIKHYKLLDEEYLINDNIKIKNDFKDYAKDILLAVGDNGVSFRKNGESISVFNISVKEEYVEVFKKSADYMGITTFYDSEYELANKYQLTEFLENNNIYSDIDLFNYIKNVPYIKSNIFNGVYKIKQNIIYNNFVEIISIPINKFTIIEGDYNGYMITASSYKEVNIIKDKKRYVFTFVGEEFTDSYINNLFNTLIIS